MMLKSCSWLKVVSFLAVGILLALVAQPLPAQVLFGSVSGTVTDQSGAQVPKAHVTLVNKATSVQRAEDTDESGYYTMSSLPRGNYYITVKTVGFKLLTLTNITITANVET